MAGREIARQWFIPGEGIDRHVISADIQRYLGNDATVRPGVGNGDHEGVQGYWIKAYRNLTSAMLADLRADSARWRQEQRTTGTRGSHSPVLFELSGITVPDSVLEPYVGSHTYNASSAGRPDRRHGDSPSVEGSYGAPSSTRDRPRERLPPSSRGTDRMDIDRMDIDPPPVAQPDRRGYREPERGYQPERGAYPPSERSAYPPERSAYPQDSRPPFQPDPMQSYPAGRPPVTTYAAHDPRYATSYAQNNDSAPPGYVRQGNFYVPVSGYEPAPAMPPSRSEPPQYPNGPYAQPAPGREAREPRYGGQPDYSDPRYAYPSPATTTVSVSGREREPIASPPQPSAYGSMSSATYDQYGRPVMSPSGPPERTMPSTREREPAYPRERERTTVTSRGDDSHRSSRRRVQ